MKKSVRVIMHACFWILFPLAISFYNWARQADSFPGFSDSSKNYFQILSGNIQSLFIRPDIGSEIWSLSNVTGIFFNIFSYIIFPIVVFYLFYSCFIPKALVRKDLKNKITPVMFVLIVPFVIIQLLSYVTFTVAWNYTYSLSLTYVITAFFATSGFFFRILENWILTQKLAQQNLQSELALLKNQINPHFLFNTLNNIDSLIKSNAEGASETLVKLSGILRYMIYDTNIAKVQLSQEIEHIESYMDLQKIQFANKDLVSLSIQGNPANISIAPMLFIPFVENAFKHCNDKSIPNAIRIAFSIHDRNVIFESINVFDSSKKINKDKKSGIGLSIVQRRLELIYPGMHTLDIREENNTYHVILSVNTNEN